MPLYRVVIALDIKIDDERLLSRVLSVTVYWPEIRGNQADWSMCQACFFSYGSRQVLAMFIDMFHQKNRFNEL